MQSLCLFATKLSSCIWACEKPLLSKRDLDNAAKPNYHLSLSRDISRSLQALFRRPHNCTTIIIINSPEKKHNTNTHTGARYQSISTGDTQKVTAKTMTMIILLSQRYCSTSVMVCAGQNFHLDLVVIDRNKYILPIINGFERVNG